MEMSLTNVLLVINLLQVKMIFYQVYVTFQKRGYFDVYQSFGRQNSGPKMFPFPADEPTSEPEQAFLKYTLMIGLSLLVVFIPIVIIKMKSNQSPSSSGAGDLLDLSYEERWDYINKKEEEIKKREEEQIAKIESKLVK